MTKRCCALLCKNTPKCWVGKGGGGGYIAHPSYCPSFVDFIFTPNYCGVYIYIAGVRGRRKERGVKIREMWERYDILFFPFSFF